MTDPARPTLRPATPDDEAFLAQVYISTRPDLEALPLPPDQRAALLSFQTRAQEQHYTSHYPGVERLIVELDGVPVGRLYRWQTAAHQFLLDIALLPRTRRAGLGTQLIQEELRRAAALGLPLRLHVEQSNPARRLYARLGFELLDDQDTAGVYVEMEHAPGHG
ncbi:GNAT family N-acetyltransferase (plasmid) [Deinococcus sp. KNUC1210]|uniref:GNAT family N-acetyltransferase n=1 Tax=Deinococcus sp. KNUC1210 TaxID=2917691 RepID=UPI001EEFCA62|nr:GNAT family N-acetyltransferase [Deinococcus sp. KNUC1210]ULH14118.1 GNAT family N-acetyltransferase [Deinococcus sp. KNUC1210]